MRAILSSDRYICARFPQLAERWRCFFNLTSANGFLSSAIDADDRVSQFWSSTDERTIFGGISVSEKDKKTERAARTGSKATEGAETRLTAGFMQFDGEPKRGRVGKAGRITSNLKPPQRPKKKS